MLEPFSDTSVIWQVFSILLNLGLVLLLIFALASILRRFKVGQAGISGKQLSLLETLYLSPKQKVHLVRAGEKVFLVGATDGHLALLSEVDVEIPPEKTTDALAPAQRILFERLQALHLDRFFPRLQASAAPVQPGQGE